MKIAIVTGSFGLVGCETVLALLETGYKVIGIDNDLRRYFFGTGASNSWKQNRLSQFSSYIHYDLDIRDTLEIEEIFINHGNDIELIVHTAAQPSHDWATQHILEDFEINATSTLKLLELTREYCPEAIFIFTSTNKVYGDGPNKLSFYEQRTRYGVKGGTQFHDGISEKMSIDNQLHSLFGSSKVAADIYVQEYGKYFGLKTACFRCGCITGPLHSGTEMHGFLSYLVRCALTNKKYHVFGYKGKQVRDNIHTKDLVRAFMLFKDKPQIGEVYNIGGGLHSSCSILEAITMIGEITGSSVGFDYVPENRIGDHKWWVTDYNKFHKTYGWKSTYTIKDIIEELVEEVDNQLGENK